MLTLRRLVSLTAVFALFAAASFAQDVLAAKSGLVHYVEGDVAVDGKPLGDKVGAFTAVAKDGQLTTDLGRAEVLLTPGVLLRVGEHSSIRMLNTTLADTRVLLESGDVMVESDTPMKDNNVTVVYRDYVVSLKKHGLYGFSSEPAQLKVYSGEVEVAANGQTVTVREGKLMPFTAALAQEKFNSKEGDSLYRWSKRRSQYLSVANMSAAKQARSNNIFGNSGWFYNSYYGLYTYLPGRGTFYSPFGYAFFSPYTIYDYYNPGYYPGWSSPNAGGGGGFPSSISAASRSSVAASSGMPAAHGPSMSPGPSGASASAGQGGAISRGGSQAGGRGR